MKHCLAISRRGLSMIEVVISTALISVVLVGALNAVGQSAKTSEATHTSAMSAWLADDLMAEMMAAPAAFTGVMARGPESDEVGRSRSVFDDLSDYHGWTASPPQQMDGAVIPGTTGWTRSANVYGADSALSRTNDLNGTTWILEVVVSNERRQFTRRLAVRTEAAEEARQ